jgi:hypothetical protein
MSRKIARAKAERAATYSIERVAELLGVGRNSAYEGARRGDFPTVRIGGRIVAPRIPIDRMLCLADDAAGHEVASECAPASTSDEETAASAAQVASTGARRAPAEGGELPTPGRKPAPRAKSTSAPTSS